MYESQIEAQEPDALKRIVEIQLDLLEEEEKLEDNDDRQMSLTL